VRHLGNRLRSWIYRQRSSGVSTTALVTRDLPRMLIRKGFNASLQPINRCSTVLNDRTYAARVGDALGRDSSTPYVVVVVPRILHYLIPCLALAEKHVSVVLVINGACPWETEILARQFPRLPRMALSPVKGSLLPHGLVLDILLRHADRDFVLLDPDLFVFNPSVLAQLERAEREIAVGAFGFTNRAAALTFPTTHLLALDVPAVQGLMARHRIRPVVYGRTPRRLVEPLGTLGIGDHNFVKEYLRVYDPMNLILAMAVYDGFRMRVLNVDDADVFHVGGVSYLERNARLDYFNLKLLALPFARSFADRYRSSLTGPLTMNEARARVQPASVLESIDRTIDQLARVVAERAR
jgi:hypothetical protein